MKRVVMGAVATIALLLGGTAQAALQDRDLDGNGVTDAFFDTDLNITWLRDTRLAGMPTWAEALQWADDLTFGGYTDWRLPKGDPSCGGADCASSEMGHLWYVELGNTYGSFTNTSDFFWSYCCGGLGFYWSDAYLGGPQGVVQTLEIASGSQGGRVAWSIDFAMGVRDGDVPAIPEPGTYALLLAGLAGLMLRRRAAASR